MKQIFNRLMAGALVCAAFLYTGCTEELQNEMADLSDRLSKVEASVADLKAQISAGAVVTDVQSTATGVKVTLSNGKSFELTNGKDGANGADGKDGANGADGKPGSVITIGDNGNWFIDGVDTGKPSKGADGKDGANGKDGEDGKDGINGTDGKDGEDGKDGADGKDGVDGDTIYFAPENGVWVKYVNGVKDETYEGESIYVEGVVTAVWDSENGTLTLYNVEGTEEPLVLNWSIITDLASRVQSMVNVPIYKYGNPQMEFAWFAYLEDYYYDAVGTTALPYELRYKIYPAECAAAIAADPSVLSFDCVETKSEKAPTLEVVKATADASGMLNLTVIGHDFNPYNTDDLNEAYTKNYVYALVLDDGNNVRSSEYLPLDMAYGNYVAEVVVLDKKGKEVAPFSFESLEIPYTSKEAVCAQEDATPAIKIWTNHTGELVSYVKADSLAVEGYNFDITMTALPLQNATPMSSKYFVQTIGEDGYASIALADGVTAENIGTFTTQAYEIYCEKYDVSFQIMSNIAIGREKAKVTAPEKTATWTYKSDAGVDASAGVEFYTREFSYALDSFTAENLPADTEIADVLAMAGLCSVKDCPEASAVVTVDGEMATLALSFPEWTEEPYEVVCTYALENVDVVFTFVVNTVGRSNEPIEIELPASTVTYTKDLELAGDVVDSLDVLYNAIPYDLSEMTAAEWLKDVFATNAFTYETTIQPAEKDEEGEYVYAPIVDKNSGWTTGLKLVPGATNEIHTDFTYRTDFQTDGVIPTGLEYTMEVTTWYGQEFVITKALNFDLPKYTFKHSEYYVYDSAEGYYSQVIGKFVGTPITGFSVDEINMLQAFYLYDDKGTLMSSEALAAAGIEVEFAVDAESAGIVMVDNKLIYNGADDSVTVDAKIALVNSNGHTIEIPTNFAETYADYVVKKYDPIDALTVEDIPAVEVTESKTYEVDAFDYLKLTDVKGNALLEDGEWDTTKYATDPQDVYGIEYKWGQVTVPAEMAAYVTFADGLFTFNNSGDLQLVKPLVLEVPVTFTYTWGERTATVKVSFQN